MMCKKNIIGSGYVYVIILLLLLAGGCKNKDTQFSESEDHQSSVSMGTPDEIEKILTNSNVKLFRKDSTAEFYVSRNFEPVWKNTSFRKAFIDSLQSAESQGLYFKDYHGLNIKSFNEKYLNLTNEQQSQFDILLTDAYFKFGDHLYNGKTDPKKLHEIWDIEREKINLKQLLISGIKNNDLEIILKNIRPRNPIYNQLIAAETEYRQLKKESENFKQISTGEMIEPGMQDGRIQDIQFRLLALGYLEFIKIGSSNFSEDMVEAVKKLQKDHGIAVDGNIGDETIDVLNQGYEERYNKILVNLERWRWYPRELGNHYILINIPAYTLSVVKLGDTVRTHKVMVGTGTRKTPIFSEEIEHLVFNPDWHIPPTIKTRDVIPGVRNNPDYLAQKNIQVLDSQGKQLDPYQIDWSKKEVRNYRYKQAPGSTNPLGRVKIMYPNKHLIYLHDTPSKSLFGRNSRAQSSGCVRVEGALTLAEYLLQDRPEITSDKIQGILESGRTKRIDMKQQVKVHHFYWTAWRENGKTRFTKDIYDYDKKIYNALKDAS